MINERITASRTYANLTQDALAKAIGVGKRTLADYEKGVSEPKASTVVDIAENCKINPNWLLTGKGEMLLIAEKSTTVNGNDNVTINGNDSSINDSFTAKKKSKKVKKETTTEVVSIPYLQDTYAAAGHGAINYDEVPHPMSFDRNFLQQHFGIISVKNLHIINAIGNSMEPTIKEGELLMVNPFENESMHIKDGGIYVMSCNNSILVKRIKHNPINGNLTLISDNKEYDDIPVSKDEFESCHIIGRVVGHFDKI